MSSRAYDLARHLLECVCQQLGNRCPKGACVRPGTELILDACCDDGQLSVQLISQYPSRQFPLPFQGQPPNCELPYMVATLRVTIARCVDADDCKWGEQHFTDMADVVTGITCCLNDKDAGFCELFGANFIWAFDQQTSFGPEGNCAGSYVDVRCGLPPECCC